MERKTGQHPGLAAGQQAVSVGRIGVDFFAVDRKPLVDALEFRKTQGGCAANVAVNLAKLGLKVFQVTRVGDDPLGEYLIRYLQRAGVDTTHVYRDRTHLTSLAVVEALPPSSFRTVLYRENCADLQLTPEDIPLDLISSSTLLFLTGTSLTASPARQTILWLMSQMRRNPKVITAFDVDYRSDLWKDADPREYLLQAAEQADIVFANEDEMAVLANGDDPSDVARRLLDRGVRCTAYKRGEAGAIVYSREGVCDVPAYTTQVLSTNGAGDAFAAGFCYGLLSGWPMERCTRFASAAGAIVVSRIGCSEAMPSKEEVFSFMASSGSVQAKGGRE